MQQNSSRGVLSTASAERLITLHRLHVIEKALQPFREHFRSVGAEEMFGERCGRRTWVRLRPTKLNVRPTWPLAIRSPDR